MAIDRHGRIGFAVTRMKQVGAGGQRHQCPGVGQGRGCGGIVGLVGCLFFGRVLEDLHQRDQARLDCLRGHSEPPSRDVSKLATVLIAIQVDHVAVEDRAPPPSCQLGPTARQGRRVNTEVGRIVGVAVPVGCRSVCAHDHILVSGEELATEAGHRL